VDFDIGIAVGLARQQRLHLVGVGALGKRGKAGQPSSMVASSSSISPSSMNSIASFISALIWLTAPMLASSRRRSFITFSASLGYPKASGPRRARSTRQNGAARAPSRKLAHQRQRCLDPINMGLPFGTHGVLPLA
jgi:hypothetical protein